AGHARGRGGVGTRPRRTHRASRHRNLADPGLMTDFLATPASWPKILLARATAAGADRTKPATDGAPTAATSPAGMVDLGAATAAGALEGLRIAIEELGPEGTITAIEQSGLRGRGGAGF